MNRKEEKESNSTTQIDLWARKEEERKTIRYKKREKNWQIFLRENRQQIKKNIF